MKEFTKQYLQYRKLGFIPLASAKLARVGVKKGIPPSEGAELIEALTQ